MGRHEDPEVLRRRTSFQDDLKGQRKKEPRGTKKSNRCVLCLAAADTCCSEFLIGATPGSHVEVFSPISEFVCSAAPLASHHPPSRERQGLCLKEPEAGGSPRHTIIPGRLLSLSGSWRTPCYSCHQITGSANSNLCPTCGVTQ